MRQAERLSLLSVDCVIAAFKMHLSTYMRLLLQVALDMATVKRSMLEWSLSDICEEQTDVSRGLPKMQDAYSSSAKHSAAFHRLLLAELHAGIKQVCGIQSGQCV